MSGQPMAIALAVVRLEPSQHFDTIARHSETSRRQSLDELGIELGEQIRVEAGGQIAHLAGRDVAEVIMLVPPAVVSRGAAAVGQLIAKPCLDKGLERVVD